MTTTQRTVYLCPTCFDVCPAGDVRPERCRNGHAVICCDTGSPGDERRKPLRDARGRPTTHAPRWFLEATGSLRRARP